jgi:hypothetical protein
MTEPTKRCSACGETKGTTEFGRDRAKRDGLYSRCRECNRAASRCWRITNPARVHENNRRWAAVRLPEYHSWAAMKDRCLNRNSTSYENYGARGITICDRWRNSFSAFQSDMGPRPPGTSLDRINNDLGYGPSNCRWATPTEQRANQRPKTKAPVAVA